jgi:lysophospholipase L1-like esterase
MDNIAMRGSSGTIFSKIDRQQLAFQYDSEPITLVLLQFGGNTVPYIKDENAAEKYGKWFAGHIAYLKRLLPNADFVLLGPSDMSIKEQTDFVTYPFLPEVRDALKKAAFDEGVAFWDIYEVMGGRNSMPSWVAADPPLAGPDYIHFTPRGARKVAELFYKSLSEDYKAYITKVKSQKQTEDAIQTSNTNLPNDTI